ncbi:MAG TPA: hypothetical protein VL728_19685 [Cyclobacteriaceae bacterium]|jgi:hypothetical protein|nr:hypothetical protein [Cyclobacteriaceae bacterium]
MKEDYAEGTVVIGIWPLQPRGVIQKKIWNSMGTMYEVLFDGSKYTMSVPGDQILPEGHPWHVQMSKWKAEGLARGFKAIFIAKDEVNRKYKAFYGHETGDYQTLLKKYPDLKFVHWWVL